MSTSRQIDPLDQIQLRDRNVQIDQDLRAENVRQAMQQQESVKVQRREITQPQLPPIPSEIQAQKRSLNEYPITSTTQRPLEDPQELLKRARTRRQQAETNNSQATTKADNSDAGLRAIDQHVSNLTDHTSSSLVYHPDDFNLDRPDDLLAGINAESNTDMLPKLTGTMPFPPRRDNLPQTTPPLPPLPKLPYQPKLPPQLAATNIPPDQISTDYSQLGTSDQVYSDTFSPAEMPSYTYDRQIPLKRYEMRDQILRDRQKIVLRDKGFAAPGHDDLLTTNNLDYSFTTENTVATLPNNQIDKRYYQEKYRMVNVSSRQRQRFLERPVIPEDRATFPNKQVWDEFFDPNIPDADKVDLCCLTFNQILGFDQEFPRFFVRGGELWIRAPGDVESNQYTIILQPVPRHIRYVRLRSVEVPRELDIVNKYNNLLMLDVLDPCNNDESFPWPDDLPFALILVPIGTYTITTLMDTIINLLNQAVRQFRACDPFTYTYVPSTGEITIYSEFQFHLRFWFSTTHPQFNLWEMLGFPSPFPVDENGEPAYVKQFTNLVSEPSPLTTLGLTNQVPFRKPNLDVNDYIYLAIRKLDVIQDASVTSADVYAKIRFRNDVSDPATVLSSKVFFDPLERLEKLEVQWLDAFGNLVDFNGQENSFMIEFVEYQDKLKESEFSTVRGMRNYDPDVAHIRYKLNPS